MKVLKVIGKIVAVIFCIVYFFLLTGIMTITFAGSLLSGDYYSSVLEKIDFKTIKIADIGIPIEGSGLGEDATVEDVVVKYFTEGGATEEQATAIVENKEIKQVLGKYIGEYVNFTVTGEKPKVDKKDIEKVFKNPDFVSAAGEVTQEQIDEVYDSLTKAVEELIEGPGENNGNFVRNAKIDIISER